MSHLMKMMIIIHFSMGNVINILFSGMKLMAKKVANITKWKLELVVGDT